MEHVWTIANLAFIFICQKSLQVFQIACMIAKSVQNVCFIVFLALSSCYCCNVDVLILLIHLHIEGMLHDCIIILEPLCSCYCCMVDVSILLTHCAAPVY